MNMDIENGDLVLFSEILKIYMVVIVVICVFLFLIFVGNLLIIISVL